MREEVVCHQTPASVPLPLAVKNRPRYRWKQKIRVNGFLTATRSARWHCRVSQMKGRLIS
jgi:hypothetical protein